MNDTAQIIVAVATLVTAVGSFVMSWVNRGTIRSVQAQTNGLLAEMKTSAEQRGNLQGRADEVQAQAARDASNLQIQALKDMGNAQVVKDAKP